jgi:phenylacetic acid degradation operon negative regulatory protein
MTQAADEDPPVDPQSPTMSRRHAAGSASARGLLFTVLGEFVLPTGGQVWTSTLIDVLAQLGVEAKTTRQALMRTAADGWLAADRHGRRTRWRLTARAEQLLTAGTQRIFGFTGVTADWDGQVVLILARVPERDRATRHLLRTRLGWAGFGSPAPGVWISTHTERVDEVEALLDSVTVGAGRVFVAEYAGGANLQSLVEQAWDLGEVESAYQEFLDEFRNSRAAQPLNRLIELVHAWRRFPFVDPALPRELLPARWSGERAAKLFALRHDKWSADATLKWDGLESAGG